MNTFTTTIIRILILISFAILLTGGMAPMDLDDQLLGTFWTPDKDGKIEMYKKGDKYFGKLVWGTEMETLDSKNPDPKLRSRKVMGIDIFMDFKFNESENVWEDGKIYNTSDGNFYSAELWYEEGNPHVLKVRGYLGLSIFGVTKDFERVQ